MIFYINWRLLVPEHRLEDHSKIFPGVIFSAVDDLVEFLPVSKLADPHFRPCLWIRAATAEKPGKHVDLPITFCVEFVL